MMPISNLIQTGSELLAGFSHHAEHERWQGFSHNWNLLLVLKGKTLLEYNGNTCSLGEHSLTLISPKGSRQFTTVAPWECLWVHFDREPLLTEIVEWKEVIPGVQMLSLAQEDFPIFLHIFQQITEVTMHRERFWKQLIYCLLKETILRGNMVSSRALGPQDTQLAHQMLANLQENLSMDEIARRCCLSRSAFYAKFAATFAVSPRRYREHHLMRSIQTLLETTSLSITEICTKLHLPNPFYLSTRFKAHFGMSPREYRKKCRESGEK